MTLKPDEEFVKNCLIKTLRATKAWEGEDPPDIYLEVNGQQIAVEITRLSPLSFGEDGTIQNRHSQDYFAINLCNDLNSSLKNEIPSDVDICLTLYVPVGNGRKYKKELYAYVRESISKRIETGDKGESKLPRVKTRGIAASGFARPTSSDNFIYGLKPVELRRNIKLSGSKVRISVIPNLEYSEKKIVGVIVNKNSSADILSNAQARLAERIQDKVKKCKVIKHRGPVWLALFDDYCLADHETYVQALNTMDVVHDFDRIYVIMDNGSVHQIY